MGNYKFIAFLSQKLNGAQKNWTAVEKEAYAVLFGLKIFDKWLHVTLVKTITDHNPPKFLNETISKIYTLKDEMGACSQKWNYKVIHSPGEIYQQVDAISRLKRED